jgi:expansin (peptidoglycan-binding protein)
MKLRVIPPDSIVSVVSPGARTTAGQALGPAPEEAELVEPALPDPRFAAPEPQLSPAVSVDAAKANAVAATSPLTVTKWSVGTPRRRVNRRPPSRLLYHRPMKRGPIAVFGVTVLAACVASCGSSTDHPPGEAGGAASTTASTGSGANGGSGTTSTSSGASTSSGGALVTYGQPYTGGVYNLGPVDYAETQFHNACAPSTKYDPRVQQVEGTLLAGLWDGIPNVAGYCDACIWVTTAKGKSALLRVVTYGQTSTNSIDTSASAYGLLDVNEYPRDMTWQFAKCPDTGPMMYEFQTGSNPWWTSLWVRNARVPVAKVEVQSVNHTTFVAMTRGTDGTLTDASGFGMGSFTIRTTGVDGQQVTETFPWPSAGIAGAFLTGQTNFQ